MRLIRLKFLSIITTTLIIVVNFSSFSIAQKIEPNKDVPSIKELQNGMKDMLGLLKKGEKDSARVWFKKNYYLLHQHNILSDSIIIKLYTEHEKEINYNKIEITDSSEVIAPELHTFILSELKQIALRLGESAEKILPDDFVSEVEKYINLFNKNAGYRSFFQSAINRSKKYIPAFKHYFTEKGFPEEILYFVIIESGFDANAISKAGAAGMFQFMPGTARDYGLKVDERTDERFSAIKSAQASAAYLRDLYLELGSISLALCSYNSGPGKTRNALKELENVNNRNFWILREKSSLLKKETREYIPQIYASIIMAKPENNKKFRFEEYIPITDSSFSVFYLPKPLNLEVLSAATGVSLERIYALNTDLVLTQKLTPADVNDYPLFVPRSDKDNVYIYLKGLFGNKKFDGSDDAPVQTTAKNKPVKKKPEKKKPGFIPQYVLSKKIFNTGDSLIYNVQRANTLHMIARIFKVDSDSIVAWNGLKYISIKRNQRLKIISSQKITRFHYQLPENTTFKKIAEQFNVDLNNLKRTNRSKSEFLTKGDVLVIYSF